MENLENKETTTEETVEQYEVNSEHMQQDNESVEHFEHVEVKSEHEAPETNTLGPETDTNEIVNQTKKKGAGFWGMVILGIVLIVGVAAIAIFNSIDFYGVKDRVVNKTTNTNISTGFNSDGNIEISVDTIQLAMKEYAAEMKLPKNVSEVSQLHLEGTDAIVEYKNETGNVSTTILLDTMVREFYDFTVEEVSAVIQGEKDELYTEYTSGGFLIREMVVPVNKISFLAIRQTALNEDVTEKEFRDTVNEIKDSIVFTKDSANDIYFNLDGFGKLNLNDLYIIKDKAGIAYDSMFGMVYITGVDDYSPRLFITRMENPNLGNSVIKLAKHDKYKNVYYDRMYLRDDDFGYRGFAVMTDAGMYYIKMSETIENPDEFMEEVLVWLGVNETDKFIDPGFEVKYTKDDLISKDLPVADSKNEVNGVTGDNSSTDNNSDSNKNKSESKENKE